MLKRLGLLILALSLCAPVTFAAGQDTGKDTSTSTRKSRKKKDKADKAAVDQSTTTEKTSKRNKKDKDVATDEAATTTSTSRRRSKKDAETAANSDAGKSTKATTEKGTNAGATPSVSTSANGDLHTGTTRRSRRTGAPVADTGSSEPSAVGARSSSRSTTPTGVDPNSPAGATAKCNDGTYSHSAHRSGSCSGHGGVAEWLKQ